MTHTKIRLSLHFILLFAFTIGSTGCHTSQDKPSAPEIIEISFKQMAPEDNDTQRTLQSLVKIRDISEQYATGGVYLLSHYGDRDSLFALENQLAMTQPMFKEPWRFCSMFSVKNDKGTLMGRNWDNQNVGSILISHYKPVNGYASINFARAIDMDFPLNIDLLEMAETPFGQALLLAPFYTYDGMNETGLCIGVTGISTAPIEAGETENLVFIGYLTRLVLDQASSTEEAILLMEPYVPFDLERNLVSAHFFVADKQGNSAVLEFIENKWKITKNEQHWQVMTNKVMAGVADTLLREKCWRYQSISETLDNTADRIEWENAMQILKDVSQKGTTWSVIYSLTSLELHFSAYQDWSRVYHLKGF